LFGSHHERRSDVLVLMLRALLDEEFLHGASFIPAQSTSDFTVITQKMLRIFGTRSRSLLAQNVVHSALTLAGSKDEQFLLSFLRLFLCLFFRRARGGDHDGLGL